MEISNPAYSYLIWFTHPSLFFHTDTRVYIRRDTTMQRSTELQRGWTTQDPLQTVKDDGQPDLHRPNAGNKRRHLPHVSVTRWRPKQDGWRENGDETRPFVLQKHHKVLLHNVHNLSLCFFVILLFWKWNKTAANTKWLNAIPTWTSLFCFSYKDIISLVLEKNTTLHHICTLLLFFWCFVDVKSWLL